MKSADCTNIHRLVSRLSQLADRIEKGEQPNPTGLLVVRNTKLSPEIRLQYRANWLQNLLNQRRDTEAPRIINFIDSAYALVVARQGGLTGDYLVRNREHGEKLAQQLCHLQAGTERISHYCSRRTGVDTELLAVEFFSRALDWPRIDGTEDYLAAMYVICRQPNLRFALSANGASKLRKLATDWLSTLN